jgi:hypothetical protein
MTDMVQLRLPYRSTFHRFASMRTDSACRCNHTRFWLIYHSIRWGTGMIIACQSHRADTLAGPLGIFIHHSGIQIPIGPARH